MATDSSVSYIDRQRVLTRLGKTNDNGRIVSLHEPQVAAERSHALSVPQLFVLVSTGQNVANLPPVLEVAREGDLAVWVESPLARQRSWAKGAVEVLTRNKLKCLDSICVDEVNDPAEVARKCKPVAETWRGRVRPVLVTNGGNKLTPIGVLRAWVDQSPLVLYGNDRPAEWWAFENGIDHAPTIRPYMHHRLDLDDILETSRYEFQDRVGAQRLWPANALPEDLAAPESYGQDIPFTRDLHADHAVWAQGERIRARGIVPYAELEQLMGPEHVEKWKRCFFHALWAARRWTRPRDFRIDDAAGQSRFIAEATNEQHWSSQYHATGNLIEQARIAFERRERQRPASDIGPPFERAVARRVWCWLQETGGSGIVQSLWRNVSVCRPNAEDTTAAEFDLLLVLKNGILLHLECKTLTVAQKELDARFLNLQQAGSLLAQMAVCAPIYTQFASENWFRPFHDLRCRVELVGKIQFLPFTLIGQTAKYLVEQQTEDEPKTRQFDCPPFEEALEQFVAPYRSRSLVPATAHVDVRRTPVGPES